MGWRVEELSSNVQDVLMIENKMKKWLNPLPDELIKSKQQVKGFLIPPARAPLLPLIRTTPHTAAGFGRAPVALALVSETKPMQRETEASVRR